MNIITTTLKFILLATACVPTFSSAQIYVDVNANGSDKGTSWANAYNDLQDALDYRMSNASDSILIAVGVYYPNKKPGSLVSSYNRDKAFHLTDSNVVIVGGYDASTGSVSISASTILSGDIGTIGSTSDNCYHVFITKDLDNTTVIRNLEISKGNADGLATIAYDLGVYSRTHGGGLYNITSSPTLDKVIFQSNNASISGGALCNWSSSPDIWNSSFMSNSASISGGGIHNTISSPSAHNVVFVENKSVSGGAIHNVSNINIFSIINCTFYGNTATTGAAILNLNAASTEVFNSLFFKNLAGGVVDDFFGVLSTLTASSTTNASDVGTNSILSLVTGTSFIDISAYSANRLFIDSSNFAGRDKLWMTADDGLVLTLTSYLIGLGTSTRAPVSDIRSWNRPSKPSIGAYEEPRCLFTNPVAVETDAVVTSYFTGEDKGWVCYCDSFSQLLLALDTSGSGAVVKRDEVSLSFGANLTKSYIDTGGLISNNKGCVILNRMWNVSPTISPLSGAVKVRYFYSHTEFVALADTLLYHNGTAPGFQNSISDVTQLQVFNVTSPGVFQDPHTSGTKGIVMHHGSTGTTSNWASSSLNKNFYIAEFEVNNFSYGGIGAPGGIGVVPIKLINSKVLKGTSHTAIVRWQTAAEQNNNYFAILRSFDGVEFDSIAEVQGAGNSSTLRDYEYLDITIPSYQTIVYYKLKQVDYDGVFFETQKSVVDLASDLNAVSYPNPTEGVFQIVLSDQDVSWTNMSLMLTNASGDIVWDKGFTSGATKISIDLSNQRSGIYFMNITADNYTKVVKIVKL